jgi:hypothetical protein
MDGKFINDLLTATNTKTTTTYEKGKLYSLQEIPQIMVDRSLLQQKIQEKYGKDAGNYIIFRMFDKDENKVDPTKILYLLDKFMSH